jgi:butyryl-CoA dehydrogenase
MGHRGLTACDVALEDCRVPKENLIGELNQGYKYLEYTVARVEAPGIAAEGLGIAEQALEEAIFFAQTRMQPWTGKNITVTEGVRYRVADMAMDIDAGKGLLYRVCRLNDDGVPDTRVEAAEAKLFCGQMSSRVVNSAIILHAGYGYTKEFAIERLYRDQKLVQLFGGTEDVERLIVGRDVVRRKAVAQGGVRIIEPPK